MISLYKSIPISKPFKGLDIGIISMTKLFKENQWLKGIEIDFLLPVGMITMYHGTTDPNEYWMICDGRTVKLSEYPELGRVLNKSSSKFKIPDFRGQFPRGSDNGRGIDTGRVLGSEQGDAIRNITGKWGVRNGRDRNEPLTNAEDADWTFSGAFQSLGTIYNTRDKAYNETYATHGLWKGLLFDASLVVPTANENRPKNLSTNFIIRVK